MKRMFLSLLLVLLFVMPMTAYAGMTENSAETIEPFYIRPETDIPVMN